MSQCDLSATQPQTERIIPEPGPNTRPSIVLITCAGRSGSKWMLKMLDFHPQTLGRNEPDRPNMDPSLSDPTTLDWEERAMASGARIGFVDQAPTVLKDHARLWVKMTRADKLLYMHKLQKLFGRYPVAGYPWLMYNTKRIANAQRVMKIVNARHMICRMLEETTHIPVIHLIRHPGGMLNSWLNRFAPTQDQEALLQKQQRIFSRICEQDPDFAEIAGPMECKELAELKVWCWRHAQEHMLGLGRAHPRYAQVTFEHLSQRPVDIMEPIYALCGLEYTDSIRSLIQRETADSPEIASAWKRKLSAEHQDMVDRVLDGSPICSLI
jgi:hypothetical protein